MRTKESQYDMSSSENAISTGVNFTSLELEQEEGVFNQPWDRVIDTSTHFVVAEAKKI